MKIRITSLAIAVMYFLAASAIGVCVIPKLNGIFTDMLPGEPLLWPSRIVMSADPVGFVALAVLGAASLVLTDRLPRARWPHGLVSVTLAFAMAFSIVALFWPLVRLFEGAT